MNVPMTIESREVAKMVGKQHKELLRDIRTYCGYLGKRKIALSDFFIESYYLSKQNKKLPCYLITKQGCEMIANKLTGESGVAFTARYVTKFNKMEKQQISAKFEIPQTYSDALRLAADQQDQLQEQNKQIAHDRPLALYTESILKNPGLTKASVIAKNYGMSAPTFNELLHQLRIQYKQGTDWMLYAKYQNKGYTHSEPFEFAHSDGTKDVQYTMKWTQEGQKFLYDKLKEVGIVPVIERKE